MTDLAIGLPTALRLAHTSSAAAARSCRGAGHSPAPALDGRTDGRGGRCARGVPGGGRSAVWLSPKKACSVPVSTAGGFSSWSLYQRQTRGQGELTWPLSGVGWRRPGCTGHEEGVSALWRLCPHSNLRSEITRQCPPLLLHPHLRAPLEVRNLPPTPMCLTQSKAAPPRGRGMARMPLEYQIDPAPLSSPGAPEISPC